MKCCYLFGLNPISISFHSKIGVTSITLLGTWDSRGLAMPAASVGVGAKANACQPSVLAHFTLTTYSFSTGWCSLMVSMTSFTTGRSSVLVKYSWPHTTSLAT